MKVKKYQKRKTIFIIVLIILLIYAVTMLAPMYYLVVNSLKKPFDFYENPWNVPVQLCLENYKTAFQMAVDGVSVLSMYLNSAIYTIIAMALGCISTTVTAYVLARFDFRGKELLVLVGIGAMLIPDFGSRAVIYKMYVDLNLIDTWFVLLQYASPFGMMFLITYSTFRTVSKTYAEAAKMDGASEFRTFVQVMVPMAKGVIGMTAVIGAINAWNEFYIPYMYLPSVKTLALGIQELSEAAQTYSNFTELYAAMIVMVVPIVILFVCMRDKIIDNAVAGGLKG